MNEKYGLRFGIASTTTLKMMKRSSFHFSVVALK